MDYQVGMLDEKIDLVRSALTSDGMGGATDVQAAYATIWAHIRPMKGRERDQSSRVEARADYMVVIRARDDVLASDVIRWRGRVLNIRFIKEDGPRSTWLEIEAEMGAPASGA